MYIKTNIKTILERIIEKFEGYIETTEENFEEDEIILNPYVTDFIDELIDEEFNYRACYSEPFEFSEKDEDGLYDILFTKTELFGDFENQYNGLPLTISTMTKTIQELKKVLA